MKRSQINAAIDHAHRALREHGVRLPAYAYWHPDDWRKAESDYARVTRNGLGWAVTDFGQGNFDQVGITMFDVRNGNVERPEEGTPYGEKIFVLKAGQRLPFHFHWRKTEDIISYHGGTLMIQLYNSRDDETMDETSPGYVYCDGVRRPFDGRPGIRDCARLQPHDHAEAVPPLLGQGRRRRAGRRRDLDCLRAKDRQPLRRQRAPLRSDRGRRGTPLSAQHRLSAIARKGLTMRRLEGRTAHRHRRARPASAPRSRRRSPTKVSGSWSPTATWRREKTARDTRRRRDRVRSGRDARGEVQALVRVALRVRPHRHPGQQRRHHPQGAGEGHDRRGYGTLCRRQPEGDVHLQQGRAAGDDRARAAAGSSTSRRSPARSASPWPAPTAPRSSA